jgi:hypothetical protein
MQNMILLYKILIPVLHQRISCYLISVSGMHIQNVDLQNVESQNVELQNDDLQNVDKTKRWHYKTSTLQNVDCNKKSTLQNVDMV